MKTTLTAHDVFGCGYLVDVRLKALACCVKVVWVT